LSIITILHSVAYTLNAIISLAVPKYDARRTVG